jgi:hypothetical protein
MGRHCSLLEAAAIVQVVIISEQLLMISAGNFCNKWKYFCLLSGVGERLRIALPLFETTGVDFRQKR